MTLQEFVKENLTKGLGACMGEELVKYWLRAFVLLVRARATCFPPATDLDYSQRITQAFEEVCEEFGLPRDADVEVVTFII